MPTYRVYLRRKQEPTPIHWEFSTTVVAKSTGIALGVAYQQWSDEAPVDNPVPALSMCDYSVKDLSQTSVLALGASASGRQAFSDKLQQTVAQYLGQKLDGKFSVVNYPSGFNYGITYGNNAYYNEATLSDIDTLLGVSSAGELELTGAQFSNLYYQILGAVAFKFSTNDLNTMHTEDESASDQIASILTEFENVGGTYTEPLPFGGKLQDIFDQLKKKYGSVEKLPDSLNNLRNAIASYKAIAAQSYVLHNRYYEATARLNAAKVNTKTPAAKNGGQQTGSDSYFVGFTPKKLPTATQLLGGLQSDNSQVALQMTLSNFHSKQVDVSVSGSVGISMPILDIITLGFSESASYDLSRYTSSSSQVTMDILYKGVTVFGSHPSQLSTDSTQGWYASDILSEIEAKTGQDVTGFQLIGSEFDAKNLFGIGKVFSRLKTFVISQQPEMTMTFSAADVSAIKSDFKVGAKLDVKLFGIFKLGSAAASYEVQKVDADSKTGSVKVTFGASKPVGTIPIQQQVAFVMGGVASYPPTATVQKSAQGSDGPFIDSTL